MASYTSAGASNIPTLAFRLLNPALPSLSPRLGTVSLPRNSEGSSTALKVSTPGFISLTSHGVVPHLTWDHVKKTDAIGWIHVPFESFLQHTPPVPTIVPGNWPLHKFLNYSPEKHIMSVSLRDWNDDKDITPNGKDSVSALCVRGVRTITPALWSSYVTSIKPDVVFAMTDTPFTPAPPSEKRTVKSLERSLRWLGQLLRTSHPSVFVQMAGGHDDVARDDFATGLLESLEGADARELQPLGLQTLDDGVAGYSFDLAPLRKHLPQTSSISSGSPLSSLVDLVQISLKPLPESKPRLVTGCRSPHEALAFVSCGIDLFDSNFAQRAANCGVALDFRFPAPPSSIGEPKCDIGVNLYDRIHESEFIRLAENYAAGTDPLTGKIVCPCIACSPHFSSTPIQHSSLDEIPESSPSDNAPPFTRAYIHHLLHTHEMTAHAFLAAHNLSVLAAFFNSIRKFLNGNQSTAFAAEVDRFNEVYRQPELPEGLFAQAQKAFREVDQARGKGRLAREKAAKENLLDPVSGEVLIDGSALSDVIVGVTGDVASGAAPVVADEVLGA